MAGKKKTVVLDKSLVNESGLTNDQIKRIESMRGMLYVMGEQLGTQFKKHRSIMRAIDRLDEAYYWLGDRLNRVP